MIKRYFHVFVSSAFYPSGAEFASKAFYPRKNIYVLLQKELHHTDLLCVVQNLVSGQESKTTSFLFRGNARNGPLMDTHNRYGST